MTPATRLAIAGALKRRVEDVAIRVPAPTAIRLNLHARRRATGSTGAPRLVATDETDGHADRFWAAAGRPRSPAPRPRRSRGPRLVLCDPSRRRWCADTLGRPHVPEAATGRRSDSGTSETGFEEPAAAKLPVLAKAGLGRRRRRAKNVGQAWKPASAAMFRPVAPRRGGGRLSPSPSALETRAGPWAA